MSMPNSSKESGYDWCNISKSVNINKSNIIIKYFFLSKLIFGGIRWVKFKRARYYTQFRWNKKLEYYIKTQHVILDYTNRKGIYDTFEKL